MKRLFFVVLAAALLWSGYWFVGAYGAKAGFSAWFSARQNDGWQAEYSDLALRGFPNRFDATFSDLALADPQSGLAWEMPFFQILALSYKPNHVIAIWPNSQRISTPNDKYEVTSTDLRASLVLDAGTSLPLNRANLASGAMALGNLTSGETATLEALHVAVQHTGPADNTYQFAVAADGFAPSIPMRITIDPANLLPKRLTALKADLVIGFDRPWDRFAIENARPQPTEMHIKLAEAHWGDLQLQLAGRVTLDTDGRPSGKITIKARNWRDILKMATAAGVLPKNLAGPLEQGLSMLANMAGNPKTLDIPLDFANGRMSLGPIPLGAAPIFRLR